MDKDITVSVLMPVYNGEKYIRKAIDSVLGQTFQNFELVIINDGSTDGSIDIIKSYNNNRIKLFHNDKNRGLIYTLNYGLEKCRGKYIARLDCDDISKPNRLEKQYQFMIENPDIVLCGTWAEIIDENGKTAEERKTEINNLMLKFRLFKGNPFTHSSIFFKKDTIIELGGYNEKYIHAEDYEMYTRIVEKYPVAVLPEILTEYRIHDKSITQDKDQYDFRVSILDKIQYKFINKYFKLSWEDFLLYKKGKLDLDKKIYKEFIKKEKEKYPRDIDNFIKWHQKNNMQINLGKKIKRKISHLLNRMGLFSLLKNKSRQIKSDKQPLKNTQCKAPEVDNWLISDFIVNQAVPVVDIQPFPLNEQMLLISALIITNPTHIFEWGTHVGKSAWLFSQAAEYFNINCHIHSIDLPDEVQHIEHPKEKRGELVKDKKNVTLHQGDGIETSIRIIKKNNINGRYLFYVDGDHSYESVSRELNKIYNNAPQSSILLHDTFYQSEESGYNIGPHKAIKDFLTNKSDQYFVYNTKLGLPGMTLLLKK